MTPEQTPHPPADRWRLGIVLGGTEDECTVATAGGRDVVPYADPFPRPRSERVAPGHLVAIATAPGGSAAVVWRWFDAVVVNSDGPAVSLWEPLHGQVIAQPRDPGRRYRPGTRAYLSAGLPGAPWWVEGPAVDRADDAAVDLDEVERFLVECGVLAAHP